MAGNRLLDLIQARLEIHQTGFHVSLNLIGKHIHFATQIAGVAGWRAQSGGRLFFLFGLFNSGGHINLGVDCTLDVIELRANMTDPVVENLVRTVLPIGRLLQNRCALVMLNRVNQLGQVSRVDLHLDRRFLIACIQITDSLVHLGSLVCI